MTGYYIADPDVEESIVSLFQVQDRYFYLDQPTYVVKPLGTGNPKLLMKGAFVRLAGLC